MKTPSSFRLPSKCPIIVTSLMDRGGETGVQTYINDILQYGSEQGLSIQFVGPDETVMARIPARLLRGVVRRMVRVHKQTFTYLLRCISTLTQRAELKRRLKNCPSWVVYAQDPTCALAALSLKRRPTHRVVLAVHFNVSQADEMAARGTLNHGDWLYRLTQKLEREALAKADGVVFFSKFMEQQILQLGMSPKSKLNIPNTAATPKSDQPMAARDLLAIGSLEPRKNQSYLLEVLHHASLLGRRYTLTVVGSGEDRANLEDLAHKLGIADQVLFTGRVTRASSLLLSHKVLVHAAKIENMPITLIESLAAGRPILAANVGGIPEILSDGVEGFYWPLDRPAIGAEILIRIMEDIDLRTAMSFAATARYNEQFQRETLFLKLFSYLVA